VVRPRSSKDVQTVATRVRGNARTARCRYFHVRICCLYGGSGNSMLMRVTLRVGLDTQRVSSTDETRAADGGGRTRRRSYVRRWSRPESTVFDSRRPAANRVRNRPVALPRGRRPAIERRAPVCPLPPGAQHACPHDQAAPARADS
jgi:hypothetical protein